MFIKIGNSDFWVDEIEWDGQVWYVQKQIDSKDFKILDSHKNVFFCFVDFLKTNYTFR